MRRVKTGGGWPAIWYSLRTAWRAGGPFRFFRALSSRNACKTCALGMGGQRGGMVNERGSYPEVCKKSMQAMAADMQGRIGPEFFAGYGFDALRRFSPRELEHMGRLNDPVYAGPRDTHYRPIGWDEAMQLCADRLRQTPAERSFFYSSGRSSNEAAFLLQLFARLYGTNNVNNCSYYCHQASGVGLKSTLGTGTATITLDDLHHCDLFFLIGGNPASNHPRLMETLTRLRRRGGRVIVINPLRETGLVNFSVPSNLRSLLFGQEIASQYLMPTIGGDIALLTGIAKALIESHPGAVAQPFIDANTERAAEFVAFARAAAWPALVAAGGVPREEIEQAAATYAASRAAVFAWTMGVTHHVHGVDNVRAIVNLALLRGMVGRPHAGLLPIRGHSNVQGIGSVGVAPQLAEPLLRAMESHFGVKLPTTPGLDTLACTRAMDAGQLSAAWCLGGNLFGSNPDAAWTARAFAKLDSIVYLSTTLNTGHAWGRARETLILPVKARDEESQPTTQESMFNFVRLSDGGPARLAGPRSEVEIIAGWAAAMLGERTPIDWRGLARHQDIRAAIAACIPGFEAIADIERTRQEFQIGGRTFHQPRFPTKSGKARFSVTPIPRHDDADAALRLMTIRSEGQFNTVVYEEEDLYRGQERRNVILMNAADIERLGLRENWNVTVRSSVGEMRDILVRPFDIHAGCAAMYAPEANMLVPRDEDPESHTPAFKAVSITVTAQRSGVERISLAVMGR